MNMEFEVIIMSIMISLVISGMMSIASFMLGEKSPDKEKVSVYECGFDPFHTPGEPFSMSFFLMAILFLVFDLEMSYLFPWSITTNIISIKGNLIMMLFLIILTMGLIYEWIKGGLEWE